MEISKVVIKGFRNFEDCTVNLIKKTLIIGSNDVGKTNFLHALRLLLDRSLSEVDIEPKDSDFFAYNDTNEFSITVSFVNVSDAARAKFRESIGENDTLVLKFLASREIETGKKDYKIYAGEEDDIAIMDELQGRYYLKSLNMKYIGSNRNLSSLIKREKRFLLQEAKEERTEQEIIDDNILRTGVQTKLEDINGDIHRLNYMKTATNGINKELKSLSVRHDNHEVIFEVGAHEPGLFIESSHLASRVNGRNLAIGGDGRNNQIFLSLWASRNKLDESTSTETVIFAIEEPEAHLHPHQQRRLAEYLAENFVSQVILTSHSPQITSQFAPNAIVKLTEKKCATTAASEGCTTKLENALVKFGHRLDILATETFFSSVVFLVEGQSEVLFYKALAKDIGIDLDYYNISILMVDGVGFKTYMQILDALEIQWVLRTDNDIFKVPRQEVEVYRCAGIQRAFGFACTSQEIDIEEVKKGNEISDASTEDLIGKLSELTGLVGKEIPKELDATVQEFRAYSEQHNVFIADVDLENDIIASTIGEKVTSFLEEFSNKKNIDELTIMQKKKATFMYDFILSLEEGELAELSENYIAAPLHLCKSLAENNEQN